MFVLHYKMHALLKSIAKECVGFLCVCFASLERTATEEILLYMSVLFGYILR